MDEGPGSLAGEAEALRSRGVTPARSAAADRVGRARRRFLPYVIVGGAAFSALLGALVGGGGAGADDGTTAAMALGTTSGIVVGITIGWMLLGLLQRIVWRREPRRLTIDMATAVVTIPAYIAGGWMAAVVAFVMSMTEAGRSVQPGPPNAWPLLLASAAVIYPLSLLFARRDPDRPEGVTSAVAAVLNEANACPTSYRIAGPAALGVAVVFATLFLVGGIVLGLQAIDPARYEAAAHANAGLIGIAFLVAWLGLAIGLTSLSLRAIRRLGLL
jgi:hypothetical protein